MELSSIQRSEVKASTLVRSRVPAGTWYLVLSSLQVLHNHFTKERMKGPQDLPEEGEGELRLGAALSARKCSANTP